MTPSTNADLPHSRGLLTLVNSVGLGLAFSLALIVLGYAIVEPPEIALLWASEASALAPASHPSGVVVRPDAMAATSAATEHRSVALERENASIEDPRECATDEGVTDACIYD